METKQIELKPVNINYDANNIGIGFVTKRDLTRDEALYVLEKILEFDLEEERKEIESDKIWGEPVEEYETECVDALNEFIKGGNDWYDLCSECRVTDDFFSFVPIIEMINYLQEKEII